MPVWLLALAALFTLGCGSTSDSVTEAEGVDRVQQALCSSPQNAIEAENCLPGANLELWRIEGDGDPSIVGFTTDISVNVGSTVQFKIKTPADAYKLDIFRMGYYQNSGVRLVTTVFPSASLPQTQPECLSNTATGLVDCGNWAVSASWNVPSNAVSGIYFARAERLDTGGASHIFFVVRNDASHSDILFQTSDTSWQAYNTYGGSSFYSGPGHRGYKLSYNRPFYAVQNETWVFWSEHPMVRWIEQNGYDVTYFTGVDADRSGSLIQNHKVFLSVGHDEYWSAGQRANVEAARNAGVHLGFFSGNKVFWKTRFENSIDGSNTPRRTLVCYKETHENGQFDPANPPTSTATWRDPRFGSPSDGARPENALTGQVFRINGYFHAALQVPQADGRLRFWRNTSVASLGSGQTATFEMDTLAGELDVDEDNGFRPPGLIHLSTTPVSTGNLFLLDHGSTFGAGSTTHNTTLYRHASGALVFSSGSYTWPWGLDQDHINDLRMQQATVNLFADMGVQPTSLHAGLTPATASTDTTAPTASITSPGSGASFAAGTSVTINGSASDSGGQVGGIEVSTDGGTTWHPASGRASWTYNWQPTTVGPATLRARATDDSGNLGAASAGVNVTVTPCGGGCAPTLTSISVTPANSTISSGTTQFTATGNYTNGSTQDLTNQAIWSSSNPAAATVSATGLGTAVSQGSTTVSATLNGITGTTQFTIQAEALNVVTSSLPGAVHNVAYSTTLAGSGGASPYTWSIASGLPPGLALNGGTGVISGTPTALGSFNFTVTLTDAASQTATRSLGIVVSPPSNTIWPASAVPATIDHGDTRAVTLGVKFRADVSGTINGIRFYKAAANVGPHTGQLWTSTGTLIASATFTSETASGWQQVNFATPVTITANTVYVASYFTASGHYSTTRPYFAGAGVNSPPLHALADDGSGNGVYAYGASATFPTGSYNSTNYWVDVSFTPAAAATLTSISVTPPNTTITAGNTTQYTATGHYSDGSTQNVSTQAVWSSTNTAVATINASGLASGVSQGGTTISATLSGVSGSAPLTVQPAPIVLTSIAVSPTNPTITLGGTQAFTAIGTYSNGSTENLTNQVTWISSNTGVATISSGGLASSAGAGNTTISATLSGVTGATSLTVQTTAVTLSSITVEPSATTISSGVSQFNATGTYSDGSTQSITNQVSWTSSNTAVATISSSGLATAISEGSTTITASLSGVSGTALLTVEAAPLSVATSSLAQGLVNVAYSAQLTANGGTPPYLWSIASGLPPGLSLNANTGVISGTPSAAGTYNFTVQVNDANTLVATRALSIAVAPASTTIWPSSATPATVDHPDTNAVELGVKFRSDVAGHVIGVRFYKSLTNTGTHIAHLWTSTGTLLATATFVNETQTGWQQVNFASPVAISANTVYVASYHTTVGHYSTTRPYFGSGGVGGVDSPPLHALADGVSGGNGVYAYGASGVFPTGSYNSTNYWVDVVFQANP